ncbi:extensin family protein [Neotabrizicola sp. sgz301269]|uniref:extensin-like domain-containing protein n=1 Tax=Neotabrizicola sp. sgz301269 TaxID=3276282 RepID=UPI0037705567
MRRGLILLLALAAAPLAAQEIDRSPVPPANPALLVPAPAAAPALAAATPGVSPAATGVALLSSLRPQPRPAAISGKVAAVREASEAKAVGPDLLATRPEPRPDETELALAEPAPKSKKKAREAGSRKGSVCGVNAIKGEKIAPIRSKVKGCGLTDGVRVTSISGVALSQGATIDCATAKALNTWVDQVVQPAFRNQVVELKVAAHYICRSRNNVKGAKVSEHGRGKAIDIAAVVLANGKVLSVAQNYKALRGVHRGACGIFGTTLGPGSDGYHEDHLHLDTAPYRTGPYCR